MPTEICTILKCERLRNPLAHLKRARLVGGRQVAHLKRVRLVGGCQVAHLKRVRLVGGRQVEIGVHKD
eukprot:5071195-Pyramimonas_sp.AAC.1